MRVPLNWLKDYVALPKNRQELTDKLTLAGHMLDKVDTVGGNTVIDLELRGNRADCYCLLGIAKEVSALFKTPVKYPLVTKKQTVVKKLANVSLDIQTPFVKRVMMTTISDVVITTSPKWLKDKLIEYGIDSINNIVDLTNFVMLETGEPMHAFDLDKIGNSLHIRLAKNGEKMITFQDKSLTLTKEDLVWANNKGVLSVAGAIGEKHNSISEKTTNVLLEAASYDRANIRRSIHRHNLFTDAGIRHEKDLDPNIVEVAMYRFIQLVEEHGWGKVQKNTSDYYPKPLKPWKVNLNYEFLEKLGGVPITKKEVKDILKWLNIEVVHETSSQLQLNIPTYRTDVVLEEDVIEEVLRIYGYDKIPTQVLSLEVPPIVTPNFINQELKLKIDLVSLGFDEVITSTFVKEHLLSINKDLKSNSLSAVKILNRPSPDVEVLRLSLLPNLYELSQKIKNERGELVQLFEIGKVYSKNKKAYSENRKLGIVYWSKVNNDFYHFKGLIDSVFTKIGLLNIEFDNETSLNNLANQYKILHLGKVVGYGGMYKDNHYLELDLDLLLGKTQIQKAKMWDKYPPQIEDITFNLPEQTKIGNLVADMKATTDVENVELIDVFENAYTFRVWYQNPTKTLSNQDVEKIREKIISNLNKKFGAEVKY